MRRLSGKLTYANVMSTLCFFLLLSGGVAFAASQLAKNSVGTKQLKKNSVTTAKVKKEAITAAKVKKGTLTGTQINVSTLGTVPTANTANIATSITPPEPWHEVGKLGEPRFHHGCENASPEEQTVRFYKDHEDVVHLEGRYTGCSESGARAFQLPSGFRPGSLLQFGPPDSGTVTVVDPTVDTAPVLSGAVSCGGSTCFLNGITFRAES